MHHGGESRRRAQPARRGYAHYGIGIIPEVSDRTNALEWLLLRESRWRATILPASLRSKRSLRAQRTVHRLRGQSSSDVETSRMRTAVDTSVSLSSHHRLTSKRSVPSVYWCFAPPISLAAAAITSVRSVSSAFRRQGIAVRSATRRTSP